MSITLRWIIAPLLALAAMAPLPAAAQAKTQKQQEVGLDWMLGRWCMAGGKTCLDIHKQDDGAVVVDWTSVEDRQSRGILSMVDGKVELVNQGEPVAREESRGENEIILVNVSDEEVSNGGLSRLRYSLMDDALSLEFTFSDGNPQVFIYKRKR